MAKKQPKLYIHLNYGQVICLTPEKFPRIYNFLAKNWTDIVEKYKVYRATPYKERPTFPFYVFNAETFAKIEKELGRTWEKGNVTIYYDSPNSRIIEFMSTEQFEKNKALSEKYGFSLCA